MTAGRPYRELLSRAEAAAELKNCSGTQFDPGLVEIFLTIIDGLQDSETRDSKPWDRGTGPMFHHNMP